MHLREWRRKNGLSVDEIARQLGVAQSTLFGYENGSRRPRPEIARRIEQATNGEVTAAELLGVAGSAKARGVREDAASFTFASHDSELLEEAASYGLDVAEIGRTAVERAVKTERMKRFSAENREAIESWNELVRREGLWSDGLRAF